MSRRPGPVELRDPVVRHELKRASVWIGLVLAVVGVIVLAQPLLLIFAGIVLASMLDGGARLLGRVLPIGRGWRLAIVTLAGGRLHRLDDLLRRHRARRPGRAAARDGDHPGQPHARLGQRASGCVQGGVDVQQWAAS